MEDRKRQSIVSTAIALAEKDGFDAVRLRDVAAIANVALGTVYRRFRSKEDILVAALEHEHERFALGLMENPIVGDTVEARVVNFFGTFTELFITKPNLARALLRAVSSGVPELRDKVMSYHDSMIQLIVASMRGADHLIDEPIVEREYEIAFHLQNIWFAVMVGWSGGLYQHRGQIDELMESASTLMLRGQ